MSNKTEEHDHKEHHKRHPSGPDAPQINEGCYNVLNSSGQTVGQVTVKGDAFTGTEYWFLYTTVPNGANAAVWPAPSPTNTSQQFTFEYTGAYTDPIGQRTTLVKAGYKLTLVKASCSVVP